MVKNLPANGGHTGVSQVRSLGWEDPLEEERQPDALFLPGKFHEQRSHGVAKSHT